MNVFNIGSDTPKEETSIGRRWVHVAAESIEEAINTHKANFKSDVITSINEAGCLVLPSYVQIKELNKSEG